jgi:predicted signal transduction protein with EAL and GGDEF domain
MVVAGASLSAQKTLQRLDLIIYDLLLPFESPTMSDDIVIIAIDDASINELGRWPWTRERHAELLNMLTPVSPRAIGFDLLFSEAEQNNQADARFARAIADNNQTALVVAPIQETEDARISERLPIPDLAIEAAALGHVDVELDIDGITRHFYLHAGLGNPHWPSIALAMLKIGKQAPDTGFLSSPILPDVTPAHGWTRTQKVLIAFSDPDDQPRRLSYADVISGRVPVDDLKHKYVLIGATSAGIGDLISTPGNHSHQRMPGVEIIAQELNTLLQKQWLFELSGAAQLGLTVLLIFVFVTLITLLPKKLTLVATLGGVIVTLLCSVYLLTVHGLWFAPATALIVILIAWPLWTVWQHHLSEHAAQRLTEQLEAQSQHHFISGLPNQGKLRDELNSLSMSHKKNQSAALLVIQFNTPNTASFIARSMDEFILQTIADRLRNTTGKAFVAHLNDNDFAVLLRDITDVDTVEVFAEQLLVELHKPLQTSGEDATLTPHIGISIWPTDSRDSTELLRQAYTAMFKSRMDNDALICMYNVDIGNEIQARAELEYELSGALERDEFKVFYQPQVDTMTGKLVGAEALIRWTSPKLGVVSPDTFIPVAEQSRLIDTIGQWVMQTVCDDYNRIKDAGLDPVRLAVNLSPLQFNAPDLADDIARTLEQSNVDPEMLVLEVTESILMNNISATVETMIELKNQGIALAMDDFGTGYSSLKHLQHFPLNSIKIDKSFTQDMERESTAEITISILDMAKRLRLHTVAEGVETASQADFYRRHGCDEIQGYLYSKPVPVDAFIALIKDGIAMSPHLNI